MTREQQLLSIKQVVVSLLHTYGEDFHRPPDDAAAASRRRGLSALRDAVEALAQNSDIPLHFYEFTDGKFLRSISPFTPISHPSPERG